MRRQIPACAVRLIAASTALAACGSSGGGASAGASGSKTIKIGFVTDLTGGASSAFTTTKSGIDAYLNRINAAGTVHGYRIHYVLADTPSTPTGVFTSVQKLVPHVHVPAI